MLNIIILSAMVPLALESEYCQKSGIYETFCNLNNSVIIFPYFGAMTLGIMTLIAA
jgi:hypothetical protein